LSEEGKKRKEKENREKNTTGSPSWRDHKHEYCVSFTFYADLIEIVNYIERT
jgi:hypothetical protein